MRDWTPSINPRDPESLSESLAEYYKGRNEMDAGRIENAIHHFRESLALEDHAKSAELLGECLLRSDRIDEAIEWLKVSASSGGAARPQLLLAEAYLKAGDRSAAKAAAKEALRRNASYGPALKLMKSLEN